MISRVFYNSFWVFNMIVPSTMEYSRGVLVYSTKGCYIITNTTAEFNYNIA